MSKAKSQIAPELDGAERVAYEHAWDTYMGSLQNWHAQTIESAFYTGWDAGRVSKSQDERP